VAEAAVGADPGGEGGEAWGSGLEVEATADDGHAEVKSAATTVTAATATDLLEDNTVTVGRPTEIKTQTGEMTAIRNKASKSIKAQVREETAQKILQRAREFKSQRPEHRQKNKRAFASALFQNMFYLPIWRKFSQNMEGFAFVIW